MKNSKKILAGMGVCLALGGTLLTGCSSDISVSQQDLNNLMNNANNYLVENQKQNSESVRSELMTLLVKGFNNSIYSTSFSCTMLEDLYYGGVSYNGTLQEDGVDERAELVPYLYTYKWTMDKENLIAKRYYKALYDNDDENYEAYNCINLKTNEDTYYYHQGDDKFIEAGSRIDSNLPCATYTDVYGNLIGTLASEELDGVDIVKYQDGDNVVYSCAFVELDDNEDDVTYLLILTFNGDNIVSIERRESDGKITKTISYTFDYEDTEINFDTTGYVEAEGQD